MLAALIGFVWLGCDSLVEGVFCGMFCLLDFACELNLCLCDYDMVVASGGLLAWVFRFRVVGVQDFSGFCLGVVLVAW